MSEVQPLSVVLASASPRRVDLLQQMGVAVEVDPANIDESSWPGEPARDYVMRLAREKTAAVALRYDSNRLVLGADTTIEFEGDIIGKPSDRAQCRTILARLSGSKHTVITGVALACVNRIETCWCETQVFFRQLSAAEIDTYWATGEPAGKAGSYAIQGQGAMFIRRMEGSYSSVVGLPVYETATLFSQFGVPLLSLLGSSRGDSE